MLLYLLPTFGWGVTIEFSNMTQEFIPTQQTSLKKSYYKLTSQYHIKKISKKDSSFLLLNRKKYMLKNNYYIDGVFQRGETVLHYKKAYVLGGKVYLLIVNGILENRQVNAKEVVYDGYNSYLLKKCEVRTKTRIYRRNKLTIKEK